MKYIKKLLMFIVISAVTFIFIKYSKRPSQIFPYPYIIKQNISIPNINKKSDILVIGDNQAKSITPYLKQISNKLSKNLRSKLIINSISKDGLGIHRIASILKQMKELPPVIILFTGANEYSEKTFKLKYYRQIKKNFKLYQNEKIISLIMTFPFLSKFIYKKIKYVYLNNTITPIKIFPNDMHNQMQSELKFQLFQQKLIEVIEFLNEQNKKLIIVSPAINYEKFTVKSCTNSTTSAIEKNVQYYLNNLSNLKLKNIYRRIQILLKNNPGNASLYYLLGKISKKLGFKHKVKEYYKFSLIYDCSMKNINPIFKAILKNLSSKYDLNFIDFNNLFTSKNSFIFKNTPQHIYLKKLSLALEKIIKKIINI